MDQRQRATEREALQGVEHAEALGHSVLFPSYRAFSDLFESATVVTDFSSYKSSDVKTWKVDEFLRGGRVREGIGRAKLSSYCAVRGSKDHVGLDVRPSQAVIDMIGEKMMLGDQYVINFEIIVRKGGTALVTAHYNMISGSRWLAIVHADTIPGVGR